MTVPLSTIEEMKNMCQADTPASGDAVSPSALQTGVGAEANYAELIDRLGKNLRRASPIHGFLVDDELSQEAAKAITSLLAENARLREALTPLAEEFLVYEAMFSSIPDEAADKHTLEMSLNLADLRRIAALASAPRPDEETGREDLVQTPPQDNGSVIVNSSEWRPIETAPKAETGSDNLLLFSNGTDIPIFVEWCQDGADEEGNPWSGWIEIGDGAAISDDYEPTHWLQLPAIVSPARQEDGE